MLCQGFKTDFTAQFFNIDSQVLNLLARGQGVEILAMAMIKTEVWIVI